MTIHPDLDAHLSEAHALFAEQSDEAFYRLTINEFVAASALNPSIHTVTDLLKAVAHR